MRPLAERERDERAAVILDAGILGVAVVAVGQQPRGMAFGIVLRPVVDRRPGIVPPAAPVVRDAIDHGKAELRRFYSTDFIPKMPPDTQLTPVSRTVGKDQLVDEMIFSFTHTMEMPWMLPGVAPTNKRVEIPLVAIVHFRDGKLAHEHIYWDQASVLKQIGLLTDPALPIWGVETARKVLEHAR